MIKRLVAVTCLATKGGPGVFLSFIPLWTARCKLGAELFISAILAVVLGEMLTSLSVQSVNNLLLTRFLFLMNAGTFWSVHYLPFNTVKLQE